MADDEDDYMNMTFDDAPKRPETSVARAARLRRESAARGVILSKAKREAAEKAALKANLETPIDQSNKGFRMLAKMGFKSGDVLGKDSKSQEVSREPIQVHMREGRAGIGVEDAKDVAGKKREAADGADDVTNLKRPKLDPEEYRKQRAAEAASDRLNKQLHAAQKTALRLHSQEAEDKEGETWFARSETQNDPTARPETVHETTTFPTGDPLSQIPVVIRELAGQERNAEAQRDRQREEHKAQGLRKHPAFADSDDEEDPDYRQAMGIETESERIDRMLSENSADHDNEPEDVELTQFNQLPPEERLLMAVTYLQDNFRYCFWCRIRYKDGEDLRLNCPGVNEADHEGSVSD